MQYRSLYHGDDKPWVAYDREYNRMKMDDEDDSPRQQADFDVFCP